MTKTQALVIAGIFLLLGGAAGAAEGVPKLAGTSWQLIRYEDNNIGEVRLKDPSKYTLTFEKGGRLIARIDCNRGSGTWKTDGRLGLKLGPLALTKAKCPPGSLHDQILGDWKHLQSYSVNKGNLLLLLKLDAGAYEFKPR
jgi:para-nitrobenzyl esterase